MRLKITFGGKAFVPKSYGDGMHWRRGPLLGRGGFGSVFLAVSCQPPSGNFLPSYMAVKSADISNSSSLKEEHGVLASMAGCPNIIQCFGEETTIGSDGSSEFNLLLEYGSGGNLFDRIHKSGLGGGGLPELEVRCYTKSILEGLAYIHEVGYVHCDLKPENILLVSTTTRNGRHEYVAKICDFGLAKRASAARGGCDGRRKSSRLERCWRGTPMYLSPEAVRDGMQESPSDIWSVGCIVLEMLTGKRPWDMGAEYDEESLLKKIGKGVAVPKIPKELSAEARSFLKCCLKRMVKNRLSAKTLLRHPFLDLEEQQM